VTAIPVLASLGGVVFPGMRCGFLLATDPAMAAVRAVVGGSDQGRIAVFAARVADPRSHEDLYPVGTVAQITAVTKSACCGRWVAILRGRERIRSVEYVRWEPFREARVTRLADPPQDAPLEEALASAIRRTVTELTARRPRCLHAARARAAVLASGSACDLPGAVAGLFVHLPVADRQALLEAEPLGARLEAVLDRLHALLESAERDPAHARRLYD